MSFTINEKTYKKSDLSVLKKCKPEMLQTNPFPYIVIKDCLDEEIYEYLQSHYPNDKTIAGEMTRQNCRYDLNCREVLNNKDIDPIWKIFIEYHTSKEFYKEVENIIGKKRLQKFRVLKKLNYKKLGFGMRKLPVELNKNSKKIVLDCQIGINSPTTIKKSVRGPHVDARAEIYGGLLYLKHDDDTGEGGDLNILKLKKCKTLDQFIKTVGENRGRNFKDMASRLKITDTVKYDKNTFVLFLNDLNALHEVTPREINPISRRLVNIIGEYY